MRIRPPVEGGTESTQSLGKFLDTLLGDRKVASAGRDAALALTVRAEEDDPPASEEPLPDPDPAEAPPARPIRNRELVNRDNLGYQT